MDSKSANVMQCINAAFCAAVRLLDHAPREPGISDNARDVMYVLCQLSACDPSSVWGWDDRTLGIAAYDLVEGRKRVAAYATTQPPHKAIEYERVDDAYVAVQERIHALRDALS